MNWYTMENKKHCKSHRSWVASAKTSPSSFHKLKPSARSRARTPIINRNTKKFNKYCSISCNRHRKPSTSFNHEHAHTLMKSVNIDHTIIIYFDRITELDLNSLDHTIIIYDCIININSSHTLLTCLLYICHYTLTPELTALFL
jgi:hypothetical protein